MISKPPCNDRFPGEPGLTSFHLVFPPLFPKKTFGEKWLKFLKGFFEFEVLAKHS